VARILALALLVLALLPLAARAQPHEFHVSIRPLPEQMREQLNGRFWRPGCPVSLLKLRVLRVLHFGFDGRVRTGQLVVNRDVAAPLARVFRRLYELRFPIRHMRFADLYGPASEIPKDGDVSGSFVCREAVPSPCTGGTGTGSWSNHAYGLAVDLNPVENPYVGCGVSHNPAGRKYLDRSKLRRGMVTPAVVQAFRSIGWGWGGAWTGDTKDYMHFSVNGH
jgi:hypothetical protein